MKFIPLFQKHNYLFVFLFSLVFLVILGLGTWKTSFRLDTDYDLVLPVAQFAINAVTKPQQFLVWNPYIGLGIPVLGDPNSFALSPWYVPVFLLFGANWGIRVIIAISFLIAGHSMWLLLSSLKIHKKLSIWGASLYQTSGALAALVASGHVEKLASYAVSPYVFYFMWKQKMTGLHMTITGLLLASMYLTNDLYTPWFLSIFFVAFSLYNLWSKKKTFKTVAGEFLGIYGAWLGFSIFKIAFFIRDILPYFDRLSSVNAFDGSIHAWFLPLSYLVPWQVAFYDRPTFQRLLQFRFNWYEYYAFITPFPFIFFLAIRKVIKKQYVLYGLIAIVVSLLYISLKFPYSPFYYLLHGISFFRSFRVPQRVVMTLLIPLIVMFVYCADAWIREKKYAIVWMLCMMTLLWTIPVSFSTMKTAFAPFRSDEYYVASQLRARDKGTFFVANFVCCIQNFLIQKEIPIINFYYGWVPTYAPRFSSPLGDRPDFTKFSYIRPSYIIADKKESFAQFGYVPYFDRAHIQVWKVDKPTIYPTL